MWGNRRVLVIASALATGVVATVPLVSAAAQSAEADDGVLRGPTPEVMNHPAVQLEVHRAQTEAQLETAALATPQAAAERQSSRTAYSGLSDADAQQLAVTTFPTLIAEPAIPGLELPPDSNLVRYLGEHEALIEVPGNAPDPIGDDQGDTRPGRALVEAMRPLRTENENDALKPVDSELVDRGKFMEPRNAPTEALLPEQLEDGVRLPESDLKIVPAGAQAADDANVVAEDKAFYADAGTDTDVVVSPTEFGVATYLQLRSAASPERTYIDYRLGPNESLVQRNGVIGAEIRRGKETVATISPPTAFDADGSGVPLKTKLEGDRLTLEIPHSSGDYRYPILVDPTTEYDNFTAGTACPPGTSHPYPGWRWETPYGGFTTSCENSYWGSQMEAMPATTPSTATANGSGSRPMTPTSAASTMAA